MVRDVLSIPTPGRGLFDITRQVADVAKRGGEGPGLCHLFLQHTSASLVVQENADPDVLADLDDWFGRAVQDGDPRFRHRDEGPDDMSGHIRTALTQTSLTIPVQDGRLLLGTWQAVYLYEHRTSPHVRRLVVTFWRG